MVAAVCNKLDAGRTRSHTDDEVGGSTFTFHVWPGHPHRDTVKALLRDERTRLAALWDEVGAYNEQHGEGEALEQVTFYFGQYDRGESPEED